MIWAMLLHYIIPSTNLQLERMEKSMMNELKVFNDEEFGQMRTVTIDGEPWFVGRDVAEALGYSNTRDAIITHVDCDDKDTVAIHDGTTGNPNQTVINESGVYSLIFGSKLPSAKRFKHWVTSEVLPSLRKTDMYIMNPEAAIDYTKLIENIAAIATCDEERFLYIAAILDKMGISPFKKKYKSPVATSGNATALSNDAKINSVRAYLEKYNVVDRPSAEAYEEYVRFCESCGISSILPHLTFSKIVNRILGTHTINKKINNACRKMFTY